jgi:WD40 repeat protein
VSSDQPVADDSPPAADPPPSVEPPAADPPADGRPRPRTPRRYVLTATAVVLAAATAGAATLYALRGGAHVADRAAATNAAEQMWTDADAVMFTDPQRSLRLRIAANRVAPHERRRLDLARALIAPRPRGVGRTGAGRIEALALAPDGRTVVAGGERGTELWTIADPATPTRIAAFPADVGELRAAAFTPDGTGLVLVGPGEATLWDVHTLSAPRRLATIAQSRNGLHGIDVSADGRFAIVGAGRSGVLVDISQPTAPRTVVTLPAADTVTAVAFAPDAHTVYVGHWGNAGNAVTVWDIANAARPARLGTIELRGYVGGMTVSADGKLLLTGDGEQATMWDVTDRAHPRQAGTLGDHTGQVAGVALTADARTGFTVGSRSAIMWDLTRPAHPQYLASLYNNTDVVSAVGVGRDGRTAVTAGWDGRINVWDVASLRLLRNGDLRPVAVGGEQLALAGYATTTDNDVTDVAVTADGKRTATASHGGPVIVWDTASPRTVKKLAVLDGAAGLTVFSDDGAAAITGTTGAGAVLWDLTSPAAPRRSAPLPAAGTLSAAAFGTRRKLAVTAAAGGTATLWDISTPASARKLVDLPENGDRVPAVAFNRDATGLLVASTYDTVTRWDITDAAHPRKVQELPGHPGGAFAASFGGDGRTAITADGHGTALLWDLEPAAAEPSPRSTFVVNDNGDPIYRQQVRMDGRVAAVDGGSEPGALWLLADRDHPTWLTSLPNPRPARHGLAWSANGRTAVAVDGSPPVMSIWSFDSVYDVLADPLPRACALASGGLTRDEWTRYARWTPFQKTCPDPTTPPGGPPHSLVGTWRVHGASLEIAANLTGTERWNEGPCRLDVDPDEPMCAGIATIRFVETPDGLTGTLTQVVYQDQHDRVVTGYDPGPGAPRPGQTFHLWRVDLDVLQIARDGRGEDQGNPYLCGPVATDAWHSQCNA